ncbi:cyclic-di-AMP receptor [Lentilactobacillus sp. Marseille-Q4993]|uniref:cyclic-di-AMP receptor n=1 Tax=Lentilactobacillus sp. Marseille-Q4993 TaxID=3039492 RepID=UPI0024BC3CBF|nr:cyclic-di-AMP receptor [Lentilactobacillus sp. Marseille-Q4993]
MKLVIAIVQDKDANKLRSVFVAHDIIATRFSTTGSFLRAGNTTYLVGVDDDKVDLTLQLIKETCSSRQQFMTPPVSLSGDTSEHTFPIEVQVGGATVMVLPIESFHQF